MSASQAPRNRLRTRAIGVVLALAATASSRADAATLTRGPYLQLLGRTEVTVVWNTDVPAACSVAVRPLDAGAATLVAGNVGTVCAIRVPDLLPATAYAYTPRADDVDLTAESVFHTDDPAGRFAFVVVGDSGAGRPPQYALAARMVGRPVDFALSTGDMIYEVGAPEEYDPQFFRPYADLLRRVVFWPCLGNHDVATAAGAPWREAFYLPANNPAATENYYSFDYGNAHVLVLDTNQSTTPTSAQYKFADQDLAASTKAWKFVAFHHTIYSGGSHGGNLAIRSNLVPLFDARGVDMVFMGHDHDYERSLPLRASQVVGPGEGTVYVTTGGGGKSLTVVTPSATTAYAESSFHFVRVSVDGGGLFLQMVRADGSIGDTWSLARTPVAAPRCGDDLVNQPGETCDGLDRTACAGACRIDCTCAPVCGDGAVDPASEACDGAADAACPGRCRADCTCGTAEEFVTLSPIADTYVESGTEATWDHGRSTGLDADTKPVDVAYLKFDLSGIPVQVERATLRLSCSNASIDGGSVYPVDSSSWIEGTLSGSSKTSAGGPGLKWTEVDTNVDGELDALDTTPYLPDWRRGVGMVGPVAIGATVAIDVTALLQNGPGLYTLAVRNDSTDGATYASEQHANPLLRPRLRLQLGGPLPPTTTSTSTTLPPTTTTEPGATSTSTSSTTSSSRTTSTTVATTTTTSTPTTSSTSTPTTSSTSTSTVPGLTLAGTILADTFVREQEPTAKFGTRATLEVRARTAERKNTFLRVRVDGTAGRTVTSAHLLLRVKSMSGGTPGARVHPISDCGWVETTVTWATQPAIDGPVLASQPNVPANATADFDVTAAIAGDGTYCFALDGTGNGPVVYHSRESATPPRLVVQVAP